MQTKLPVGRAAVGHPVDVATGAVFTAWHDFELPGTIPLIWRRHYATNSAADSPLGRRWTTPFFMTLVVSDGTAVLTDEAGVPIAFDLPEEGLAIGDFVRNLYVNMELWRAEAGYTIVHWHHGSAELEIFQFAEASNGRILLTAIENRAGHRQTISYDHLGRPCAIFQEMEQRRLNLEFGPNGLLAVVLLVRDNGEEQPLVTYRYDETSALVSASDAIGSTVGYAYDELGRMTREQNPLGSAFHFRYDAEGRCFAASGDNRYMYRRLRYEAGGRAVHVTDSLGNVSHYYLNVAGQVLQQVSPLGAPYTWEYDEFGRISYAINPDGTKKAYEYDAVGNRTKVVYEDGTTRVMSYDDSHAVLSYGDQAGSTWAFELNEYGLVLAVTNPVGNTFKCTRNGRQLIVKNRTPEGRFTESVFDQRLRWWEVRDELSLIRRTETDERGNITATYDAAGLLETTEYDLRGRPAHRRDVLGNLWSWQWNALGKPIYCVTPTGRQEVIKYSSFGQIVSARNPLGEMKLEYDTEGRITAVVNRRGERLERCYDEDGRLREERSFDGRIEAIEYDVRGKPRRIVRSDGSVVDNTYDARGNVVCRASSDGRTKTYQYDPCGRIIGALTGDTELAFNYDPAGRLISEVQNGHVVEHDYDADNYRIGWRLLGKEVRTAYDQRGRLSQIGDADGVVQMLIWNDVNQLIERRSLSGLRERLSYRRDNRLMRQEVLGQSVGAHLSRTYERDQVGNILHCRDSMRGECRFSYDDADRLISVERSCGPNEIYSYDEIDCITATHRGARVLGSNGRTVQEGETRYSYDAAGCLSTTITEEGETQFSYSTDGHLIGARLRDGRIAEITYDALGRRCRRKVGEDVTEYLWNGFVIAAEMTKSDKRIFLSRGFDVLAEWDGDRRQFPIGDTSGAVREVFDERGDLVWSCALEAYGLLFEQAGSGSDRQRMRGQYSDNITGLHDNVCRTYHPGLGGYVSPDPIGLGGGFDYYGYPRNPLRWNDPFGLNCSPEHDLDDDQQPALMYHYTNQDEAEFASGLWRDTSVTDKLYTDPNIASQELGIPIPDKVIPIIDKGQFVPNRPPIVQPSNRYIGGGTDFINPKPVPATDLLPARSL